jgi:hypothetical protein
VTRKHFEVIAAVINNYTGIPNQHVSPDAVLEQVARDLAREFKTFNPNFDRARFLAACGVEQ